MALEKRVGKRKTLTIDRSTADIIKEIANRRGLTISTYMRKLIDRVLKLEELGVFAPAALDDLYVLYTLSQFRFVPIPIDFVDRGIDPARARALGTRIGTVLKELGADVETVVEVLCKLYGVAISSGDKLIIVPTVENVRSLAELVKGIATGGGLEIEESGGVFAIRIRKGIEKQVV